MRSEPIQAEVATSPAIVAEGLAVAYRDRVVLRCPHLSFRPAALHAIVGPNGAGKSTFLKALLGMVPLRSGRIKVFGGPIDRCRDRVAYVPQRESVDWDFPITALEVVTMGLYRRIGWLRPVRRAHRDAARGAMDRLGIADLWARPISELSGGQQQRVFLARALVQEADLILLDEPLANVDATTAEVVLDLLAALRDEGRTIVAVHHGIETVRRRFDDAVLLDREPIAVGAVSEVLTPELLRRAYGERFEAETSVAVRVAPDPVAPEPPTGHEA